MSIVNQKGRPEIRAAFLIVVRKGLGKEKGVVDFYRQPLEFSGRDGAIRTRGLSVPNAAL